MTMMILKFPSLLLLLLLATVVTPEVITAFVTSPPLSSVVQRRVQSIALNAKTPQQQQQKKRQQRQQPGSELFPTKGSSYVPLGLTADEYAKIKRKEKEELAKMNFGMFGPRFAPSSTPGGDWFLTPKLWTMGFQSGSDGDGSTPSQLPQGPIGVLAQVARIVREATPAYALSYALLTMILSAGWVVAAAATRKRATVALQSWSSALQFWLRFQHSSAVMATKVLLAGVCAGPAQLWIETANRQRLWSPRRTVVTSVLGGAGMLSVWTAGVLVVKQMLL